jgi:hypothetical protein
MANGCSEAIHCSVADAYRSLALAVFGTGARDKMQLAEMSVASSIADIAEAEEKSTRELAALVKRVRDLDPKRHRGQVLDLLARTRVLRGSLAGMAKKRGGMEQNLETLRQSQLNQNMLLSMRHTTDALQTLGLKVSDADNIMLDLEESTGDLNALQTALSSGFEADLTQEDLEAELELVLSDDALCPAAFKRPKAAAAVAAVTEAAAVPQQAGEPRQEPEPKREPEPAPEPEPEREPEREPEPEYEPAEQPDEDPPEAERRAPAPAAERE